MSANNELLNQQLDEAGSRAKPKGVKPPVSAGISYNVELQKLVRMVRKDINEQIVPVLRQLSVQYTADGWVDTLTNVINQVMYRWSSPEFDQLARQLARRFITTTSNITTRRFNSDMKRLGVDVYTESPELQEYLDAAIYDNTQLIKSIPSQYLERVQSLVMTNTRAGTRPSAIVKNLQEQFGVTERRAKFIATDQTLKVNGDVSERRQKLAGFDYFRWVDSDDSRVRHRHEEIANRVTAYGKGIYRWDNLPLSDDDTPIKPGQDYHCRCIAVPVSNAEVEENIKAGRTRSGVKR